MALRSWEVFLRAQSVAWDTCPSLHTALPLTRTPPTRTTHEERGSLLTAGSSQCLLEKQQLAERNHWSLKSLSHGTATGSPSGGGSSTNALRMGLIHMLADNDMAWRTLGSPQLGRQVPPAALCLACSALGWGSLALGGPLAGFRLPQPHCNLQVPAPFC